MPSKTTGKRSTALEDAGAAQPKRQMSPAKLRQLKAQAEQEIDDFMKEIGITDPAERTDDDGMRHFENGSAAGFVGVVEDEGELYLTACAPIMPLPSDRDLMLPLMRELLELNLSTSGGARLGIVGDSVVAAHDQRVAELDGEDIRYAIFCVMMTADDLDDKLQAKYGGTSKKRTASAKSDGQKPASKKK